MILEGLVTTLQADGQPHLAPMGPEVDEQLDQFVLKPFRTSQTYANLKRSGQGVLHVTDDVELLAHAAVGRLEHFPPFVPASAVEGVIVANACRWYAFRVVRWEESELRARLECQVLDHGTQREFFGFNRGKHAVLEAAILATRLHLLPASVIQAELDHLQTLVDKTGGLAERRAFAFLVAHIHAHWQAAPP
jgi:hypothetical protein